MSENNEKQPTKTIRSRADKQLGEIIEDKWRIVAKKVISAPAPRTEFAPPRFGIFDYECIPLPVCAVANKARTAITNRTAKQLQEVSDAIRDGSMDNVDPIALIDYVDKIFDVEAKALRRVVNTERRALVGFRTISRR